MLDFASLDGTVTEFENSDALYFVLYSNEEKGDENGDHDIGGGEDSLNRVLEVDDGSDCHEDDSIIDLAGKTLGSIMIVICRMNNCAQISVRFIVAVRGA